MEKAKDSFEQAEIELLKQALKRTYKERFEFAMSLYRTQIIMSRAKITHKPFVIK